jgi:hypothetical protein
MGERRATERRKRTARFRVAVTRLEFEQLHGLVERVAEAMNRLEHQLRTDQARIGQLQQEVDALTARVIARSRVSD